MVIAFEEYQVESAPKGESIPKKALENIRELFKRKYGVYPKELYIGPAVHQGQVFIKQGYVWAPLPDVAEVIQHSGYAFLTGYDTKDPSKKT